MIRTISLCGAAAAALLAANAHATVYTLLLTDADSAYYSFSLDTANATTGAKGLQTNFTNISMNLSGMLTATSPLQFTSSGSLGSDYFVFLPGAGQSFFSGSGTGLVLQTGTFIGFDGPVNMAATLKITSAATAAVPEPAAWAMMVGGFGLVGGAMRRRTTASSVAFA